MDLVENDRFLSESVVFWQRMRDSNEASKTFYVLFSAYFLHFCHLQNYLFSKDRMIFIRSILVREIIRENPHSRCINNSNTAPQEISPGVLSLDYFLTVSLTLTV